MMMRRSTNSSVTEHYSKLLAPIYLWMVGGFESALQLGAADIAPLCDSNTAGRTAVNLGAG
jgi:hypothetical protein